MLSITHMNSILMQLKTSNPNICICCPCVHVDRWTLIIYIGIYKKADYLYTFAYTCIDQEYPNKLGQVLGDSTYLKTPKELHPTFYGCFDWHSAVHGHWTLVNILNSYPDFKEKISWRRHC